MKLLRRAVAALALAGLVAGAMRLRGSGGTPPQRGGWRQLDVPSERP
jgi:alpha-beta hydrolase superfamily lysophospholipase